MAVEVCAGQAQACLIRAAELDATGHPDAGLSMYVSDALVSLAWTPQVTTGAEISQLDGCGNKCTQYKAPDTLDRLNLTLTICSPDPELQAMLAGGTVHVLGTDTVGYGTPGVGTIGGPTDVSIELWENIIIDGSIAGQARYVFPRTRGWARSGSTHGNSPYDVVLTGTAVDAGDWDDGPAGDWDLLSDEPVTLYDFALETQTLPIAACGAVPITAT